MKRSNRKRPNRKRPRPEEVVGAGRDRGELQMIRVIAGVGVVAFDGILMGQSASQPVESEAQSFVTADGEGRTSGYMRGRTRA